MRMNRRPRSRFQSPTPTRQLESPVPLILLAYRLSSSFVYSVSRMFQKKEMKITASSFLLFVLTLNHLSKAKTTSLQMKPRIFESFNVSYIENLGTCSYTLIITTSCSSTKYTRDQISIAFGDAYGNQIYTPRLDDPSTRTFEQCSSDTFQINGPCAYQICYVYLYRSGPDGWQPESVKIYGYNSRAVTFYYNTFIPSDIWYGFNLCQSASSSHQQYIPRWFAYVILGLILSALL